MSESAELKKTYLLEMASRSELRPKRASVDELVVDKVALPAPEFSWFLHQAVGAEFRWGGREHWDRRAWENHVGAPELETWVAYVSRSPAGFAELVRQEDGSVRILCFGLLRRFFGKGIGGHFLTVVVEQAWRMGATRTWLTTCSHDHPHALANYLARGFRLVSEATGPPNAPRKSPIFGDAQSEE